MTGFAFLTGVIIAAIVLAASMAWQTYADRRSKFDRAFQSSVMALSVFSGTVSVGVKLFDVVVAK